MVDKPKVPHSASQKQLDQVEKQLDQFEQSVKDLTLDRMNAAPRQDSESQTQLSSREVAKSQDVYLKPSRAIGSKEKFNEKFRDEYNFAKEYVQFIAENSEIRGDKIDLWTKPFPGCPAEFWEVPPNKPVWGPRYLAEQIKRCSYHRLMTDNRPIEHAGVGTIYGALVVDTTVQRLDAKPVSGRKSVFMGASGF